MATPQIEAAALAIRRGELVVIPTETVYGLACDATQNEAALKVFAAKGRPADNPLIVHVPDVSWLERVATRIPDAVYELGRRYWPGPLTIVLPKHESICETVTGGLPTVAVRIPSHPLTIEVIRCADRPIAAPSANLFTHLSPTRIEHIGPEIRAASASLLDGGPCRIGIESTILDLTSSQPRILRHGHITASQIEAVLSTPVLDLDSKTPRLAPGMYERHYSPRTPVQLVKSLELRQAGLTFGDPHNSFQVRMPSNPDDYATQLYAVLHDLDHLNLGTICIEEPPLEPIWAAIWERLRKAQAR